MVETTTKKTNKKHSQQTITHYESDRCSIVVSTKQGLSVSFCFHSLTLMHFYLLLICIMLWLFAANKDVYNAN